MSERQRDYPRREPRRPGPLSRLFGGLTFTLAWLFLGIVLSIGLEWAGLSFWWHDYKAIHGTLHARDQLETELGYLAADFRASLPGLDPAAFAVASASRIYRALFVWREFDVAQWLLDRAAGSALTDYLLSAVYQVQLYGVRLAIATLSLPAFLVIGLVAAIEGMVDRELRKAGADFEHSMVYHFAKGWLAPTLTTTWVVYLALPFSLHPNWIFIPGALLFGYALRVTTANFKMTI